MLDSSASTEEYGIEHWCAGAEERFLLQRFAGTSSTGESRWESLGTLRVSHGRKEVVIANRECEAPGYPAGAVVAVGTISRDGKVTVRRAWAAAPPSFVVLPSDSVKCELVDDGD